MSAPPSLNDTGVVTADLIFVVSLYVVSWIVGACKGGNDRAEGFYRMKLSGSRDREKFVLKRLRGCEIA